MDMWELGLMRHWVKELTPKAEICFAAKNQEKTARQVPIRLSDLISAFLILGIGLGLATLIFLLDLIFLKFSHHNCHCDTKRG